MNDLDILRLLCSKRDFLYNKDILYTLSLDRIIKLSELIRHMDKEKYKKNKDILKQLIDTSSIYYMFMIQDKLKNNTIIKKESLNKYQKYIFKTTNNWYCKVISMTHEEFITYIKYVKKVDVNFLCYRLKFDNLYDMYELTYKYCSDSYKNNLFFSYF